MNGYGGRILSIDLSTGSSRIDTFDERFARLYLGATGLPPGSHTTDDSQESTPDP